MKILLLFLSALLSQICVAEGPLVPGKTKQAPLENIYPRFSYHGYGTINYQYYDWDTDNTKRASIDLERVSIEPSYQFSEFLRLDAEIEFEHGGTGSTMEFDKVEEFGEFESEIEKGGEIKIEEFAVSLQFHSAFNLRLGHFFVPIGWVGKWDEPTDYSTVIRSEAERALLPVLWDESGIEIYGEAKNIQYQFQIINGLDATGFSSGNWIAGGHQGRFETVNAENLAIAGRIETNVLAPSVIGFSGYFGNTTDNRPKPDLHVPSYVNILSAHAYTQAGPVSLSGLVIWGHLSNSEAVSKANGNLSSKLNVKRTPIGSQAYAAFLEAKLDILAWCIKPTQQAASVFSRIDSYDTMQDNEGVIFDNPYWNRIAFTGGINYSPRSNFVLKTQYSRRMLQLKEGNIEDTFSLGFGIVF